MLTVFCALTSQQCLILLDLVSNWKFTITNDGIRFITPLSSDYDGYAGFLISSAKKALVDRQGACWKKLSVLVAILRLLFLSVAMLMETKNGTEAELQGYFEKWLSAYYC